jgi:hypothetical protein
MNFRIFLYIYFIAILQKYMFRRNFAKIYIWRGGLQRQGHNAMGHDAWCRQEWALSVAQT